MKLQKKTPPATAMKRINTAPFQICTISHSQPSSLLILSYIISKDDKRR